MKPSWNIQKIAALLVCAILAVSCVRHSEANEEHGGEHGHGHGTAELLVTKPLVTDTEITRSYVAQIEAIQHIEVRALEGGYLQEVFVDEGQLVEEGAQMFQIMPAIYRAEVKRASAEARFARIEFENTKMLKDGNVVSANELALAKARLDKASAEASLAQAHLRLTMVRAPFEGIMNRLHVRRGSLVEEGELLTTLSDTRQMWVYFNVAEAEYLDYKMAHRDSDEAAPVRLQMANHAMFDHPGKIDTIEGEFNRETGNIAFRATFPNPEGLLRHGETGNVLMSTPLKDVIVIPQKATFEILDKRFVFVVDGEDKVRSRQIKVAEEMPHLYVVAEGLEEQDRILVEGIRKVRDGDQIIPRVEEPEEVIKGLDVPAE
ncbi:MAG: efflux transporter periplasmic adaptor subunit [Myxococcales bacterium]|nr:efflux transporter periplasmic adaptor subunit [Myxococcales bacterium]